MLRTLNLRVIKTLVITGLDKTSTQSENYKSGLAQFNDPIDQPSQSLVRHPSYLCMFSHRTYIISHVQIIFIKIKNLRTSRFTSYPLSPMYSIAFVNGFLITFPTVMVVDLLLSLQVGQNTAYRGIDVLRGGGGEESILENCVMYGDLSEDG